jgi:peptide/nickel transport system substrate-binding protein
MTSRRRGISPPTADPLPSGRAGWPLLAALAGGIVAVAAAWFAFSGSFGSQSEPRSHRYAEAVVGAPSRINPLFAHLNDADRDLATLVFSGLTRLGADGAVLPDLAERWDISEDGRDVTFHLRSGVTWHNGTPFTAADVVFTYALLADPKLAGDPDQEPLWRRLACSAPDDTTVACQLPEPFAPFPAYASIGILPKHLLEGTDGTAISTTAFNGQPIGTGPYRLVNVDQSRALLRANDKYHLGTPQLAEIELLFFSNVTAAAAAVLSNQAQGILLYSASTNDDYEALAAVDGLRSFELHRTAFTVLYLNTGAAPLNDAAVRQSIAEAVDVDDIIDSLPGGRGVRADSPIVAGTWAHNPDFEPIRRDLGSARDRLDDAGWVLPDDSRIRSRNGVELRMTLLTDQDPVRGIVAEAVAQQLSEIGMSVTLAREESTDLIGNFLIPRQYQAAIFGWDPGPDPDPYPAWHSSQARDSGRNLSAYANEQADRLMEDARLTMDLDERQRLYFAFQDIFRQDVPSLLLFHPVNTYFVTEQIQELNPGVLFTNSSRFRNVHEWVFQETVGIGDP